MRQRIRLAIVAGGAAVAAAWTVRRRRSALDAFHGRHVVLTGGSRGLGFALARRLLGLGARVTICGRSAETLARAERELAAGDRLTAIACDVRSTEQCERLVRRAIDVNGPIDILINNAGTIEVGPFDAQTRDDFNEALETHFWGPLQLMWAVLPGMRARRRGHIVNVASIGGIVGVPHLAPYSASKFAQIGLTQALRAELGADGVTLTSIVPGLMITGSPDHAIFNGRHRAEFAWFTLSDANPLLSTPVEHAVTRVVRAIRRRRAHVTIGASARAAEIVNALFPETTAALLSLAARLLPPPADGDVSRHTGAESHSAWTDNLLTILNTRARERTNQDEPPAAS